MSLAGGPCAVRYHVQRRGAFVEKITLNQLGIIGKYMLAVEKSALFSMQCWDRSELILTARIDHWTAQLLIIPSDADDQKAGKIIIARQCCGK